MANIEFKINDEPWTILFVKSIKGKNKEFKDGLVDAISNIIYISSLDKEGIEISKEFFSRVLAEAFSTIIDIQETIEKSQSMMRELNISVEDMEFKLGIK